MTNFAFLEAEWPSLYEAADKASNTVYPDPRAACFYARRALELAVQWMYKHDYTLLLPYQENLSALIHEPTFKKAAGEAIFNKARIIIRLGNQAVHSNSTVLLHDSLTAVGELFHISYILTVDIIDIGKSALFQLCGNCLQVSIWHHSLLILYPPSLSRIISELLSKFTPMCFSLSVSSDFFAP